MNIHDWTRIHQALTAEARVWDRSATLERTHGNESAAQQCDLAAYAIRQAIAKVAEAAAAPERAA